MELSELMRRFAEESGISALGPDEKGMYAVLIDNMTVTFRVRPDQNLLETRAPVCAVTEKMRDTICPVMLESMFLGQATGGSAFILDEEKGEAVLCRTDWLTLLDVAAFRAMLEKFVNILEEWRNLTDDFAAVVDAVGEHKHDAEQIQARLRRADGFLRV